MDSPNRASPGLHSPRESSICDPRQARAEALTDDRRRRMCLEPSPVTRCGASCSPSRPAGSDIAGVQTRADPVSGGWLINGQKVWTTLAHRADFGLLLARTDSTAAKHAGLSMLIIDLGAAGVEVRRSVNWSVRRTSTGLPRRRVRALDSLLPPAGAGWRIARRCCTISASLARRQRSHHRVLSARPSRRCRTPRRAWRPTVHTGVEREELENEDPLRLVCGDRRQDAPRRRRARVRGVAAGRGREPSPSIRPRPPRHGHEIADLEVFKA